MADDKIQQSLEELSGRLGQLETVKAGYKNYATFNSDAIRDLGAQFTSIENKLAELDKKVTHGASSQGTSGDAAGSSTNSTPTGSGTYQVTTDTNFTLPTLYGTAQIRGAVFDAELRNNNANLVSCIALSEITGYSAYSTDYTVNEVYFNDALLQLDSNGKVTSATLNDGNTTNKYNENTSVRVYQGLSWVPVGNIQPGVAPTYASATTYMDGWNGITHRASNMLFAQIEQQYDAANGVQGIGTWTFDITNNEISTNPGDIVLDYLRAERYGANYDFDSIDTDSFTGVGVNSLKSVSNQEFLFTTLEASDSNVSAISTITTGGAVASMTNVAIFQSGATTTLTANLMSGGDLTANVDANNYNRFKLFWAKGADSGDDTTDISMIGTNTLKGFLDISRPVPGGANASQIPGATDPVYGDPIYTSSNATPITAFLLKGDKIRPEGSRVIYTVAEDVDVPNPGYDSFDIPLEERVIFLEVDPFSNTNANLNVVGSDPTVAWGYDPDFNLVAYNGEWPSAGAFGNVANMDAYSNVIFSNALVGSSAFSSPSETLGGRTYLGTEPKAQINGLLDNTRTVRENINELMRHSFAELTYDNRTGKWRAVPDGNTDTANAFIFSEENILSELTVATSDVSNFFNASRATYVEKTHNSVSEDVIVYTSEYDKNANESDHMMELSYPLTVSGSEAARKADEKLRQNRKDMVLQFTADYSAIVVDPGDLVKVTVDAYGFDEKLFKVLKNEHSMEGDILKCRLSMTEWDLGVFSARIPFRKPVLDDISFEPEIYDNRIDAGGIDPETYPPGAIDGDAIANGSLNAGAIDSSTWDGVPGTIPGSAIEDETVDTDQLANASVTPVKISVGIPTVRKYALNKTYTKNWTASDTIYIVGNGLAPDYNEIDLDILQAGLYTLDFTCVNLMGTTTTNHYGKTGHHHEGNPFLGAGPPYLHTSNASNANAAVYGYTAAGFPGERNAFFANTGAYDIGGADVNSSVFDLRTFSAQGSQRGDTGSPFNTDPAWANVYYNSMSPLVESEVTLLYLPNGGSAVQRRTYKSMTAAGGSTINLSLTLDLAYHDPDGPVPTFKIEDWRVSFYNTGQHTYQTLRNILPGPNGESSVNTVDVARGSKVNAITAPTITLTTADGFTFS